MKPYLRYRTTDSEWIGDIPDHWEVQRLANFGEFLKGRGISKAELTETGLPAVIYGDLYTRYGPVIKEAERFIPEKLAKQSVPIQMGDLLFTGSGETALDIGRCAAYMSDEVAYAGGDLNIYRQDAHDSRFLSYCLNTQGADQEKARLSRGQIIVHIYQRELRELKFPCPPRDEQEGIVAFLDHQTGLIDELIEKNTKLLELLDDQRKAIINEAVTKGLDPMVPMKDSGVEWLGEVPKSWTVGTLKHLLDDKLTYGANEAADEDNPDHPRYIRITDFDNDGRLRSDTYRSLSPAKAKDYLLEVGDVLFARSGATVGKTFMYTDGSHAACFAGYLIRARCDRAVLIPEFLYLFTKSTNYENWKNSSFIQATIQNIGADKYAQLVLPLPPLEVQEDIVNYLSKKDADIQEVRDLVMNQGRALEEYRQSLISEAVTGKIDLREWEPSTKQVEA